MLAELLMQDADGKESVLHYDTVANALFDNGVPVAAPLPNSDGGEHGMVLRISLGKACNFSCAYCHQAGSSRVECAAMSPCNLAEHIARVVADRPIIMVQFWGGEPFLYFHTIKELHRLLVAKGVSPKTFFLSTNGSLLHGKRLEWVLEHDIAVALSWDGPGQDLRGKDVLNDPKVFSAVMTLLDRQPDKFSFAPVMTAKNPSLKAYEEYLKTRLGRDDFMMGDSRLIIVADETARTHALPEDALPGFCRKTYLDLAGGRLSGFSYLHSATLQLLYRLGKGKPSGSRCFVSSPDTLTIDLAGNILTCQNFSAGDVDRESGEPHRLGHISELEAGAPAPVPPLSRLKALQQGRCADCLVYALCQGGCPYSPSVYEDYNCRAYYSQSLPLLGMALYQLTGKLLKEVPAGPV